MNWKTSLGGLILAIGAACLNSPDPTVHMIGQILSFLGPVILGYYAKDKDVTGGTKCQSGVAPCPTVDAGPQTIKDPGAK